MEVSSSKISAIPVVRLEICWMVVCVWGGGTKIPFLWMSQKNYIYKRLRNLFIVGWLIRAWKIRKLIDWQTQTLNPSKLKGERPVQASQSWNTPHVELTQAVLAGSLSSSTCKPGQQLTWGWLCSEVVTIIRKWLIYLLNTVPTAILIKF